VSATISGKEVVNNSKSLYRLNFYGLRWSIFEIENYREYRIYNVDISQIYQSLRRYIITNTFFMVLL
jgi:hypothetical protein